MESLKMAGNCNSKRLRTAVLTEGNHQLNAEALGKCAIKMQTAVNNDGQQLSNVDVTDTIELLKLFPTLKLSMTC